MHKLGTITAFIFNKFFLLFLIVFTLILVPVISVTSTLTDPEAVKNVLSDSDVYNTVPNNILDIAEVEAENALDSEAKFQENSEQKTLRQVLEKNNLIDPDELTTTIQNALGDEFIQTQVESLIDSLYAYMDSSNEKLEFSFSLKERADIASTEFKELVSESLANIPECDESDIRQHLDQKEEDFNLLEADCLPPGAEVNQEINKFIDEATAEDGVFGEVYTEKDLGLNGVELDAAKLVYSVVTKLPFILWSIVIGLSVIVVVTSKSIHKGLKVVGVIHFIIGILMLVGFMTASLGSGVVDEIVKSTSTENSQQEQAIRNIASPIAENIADQATSRATLLSVVLMLIGVCSFVVGIMLTKHHVEHLSLHGQESENHNDKGGDRSGNQENDTARKKTDVDPESTKDQPELATKSKSKPKKTKKPPNLVQ